MPQVHQGVAYRQVRGEHDLQDVTLDACSFDNCRLRGGTWTGVQLRQARAWACSLEDVVLRDCVVDGLRMSLGGSGGKTSPLRLTGVLAERVVLRGRIGSLIWNPPGSPFAPLPAEDAVRRAREFYAGVEGYALDVTEARFSAVPSLRYGPPGHLVRHDPERQPLVTLAQARELLAEQDPALGVWGYVLGSVLRLGWPDSLVLVPAELAPKAQRERDQRALAHLRSRLG